MRPKKASRLRVRRAARSAARSTVEAAQTAKGRPMALRGPAGLGPGSCRPLDEAVAAAEGREALALVATGATLEDDEEDDGRGRGLLRLDGFSAWLHCVCVVGFDLELGQAVEIQIQVVLEIPSFVLDFDSLLRGRCHCIVSWINLTKIYQFT